MATARIASSRDYEQVAAILRRDPVEALPVAAWLGSGGPTQLGTRRIWLCGDALCYSGANLLPVHADEQAARAFARLAIDEGRRCSSIVARLPSAHALWAELEPTWGPARAIRQRQIVMVSDSPAPVPADPDVREAVAADFDRFYAASIEMYIEEIGISPVAHDGGHAYRWRASELISSRQAYIRTDGPDVVFKAELGAVSADCAQLQGVWVHPDLRGQGIGTAGTAQVLALARRRGVSLISLAVNDFNHAALHSYARCGFRQVAEQMVVLF